MRWANEYQGIFEKFSHKKTKVEIEAKEKKDDKENILEEKDNSNTTHNH